MAFAATGAAASLALVARPQGVRAGALARSAATPDLAAPTRSRPHREWAPHGRGAAEERAAERGRAFTLAAAAPPTAEQLSFLELQGITPKAAQDYHADVSAFHQWCPARGLVQDFEELATSAPAIDFVLMTYVHEKFFAGELACVPTQLMSRLPRPRVGLCLCVQHVIGAGQVQEAVASVIAFALYPRPSECLRLKGKLIAAPAASRAIPLSDAGGFWSNLLRPQDEADTSMTERWLGACWRTTHSSRGCRWCSRVPFGQAQWGRALKTAAAAAGLSLLGDFSLRRLRRGGVSHELLFNARSLLSAQERGRWASDRSLARNERGGRINEQLSLLDLSALTAAESGAQNVGDIL
ncbi:unnamed protein product, partial [Prorocentrum cordatum]